MEGFLLSPLQERLWRLSQTSGAYVGGCVLELRGELDQGRLERAVAAVVARHEILRTTFPVPSMTLPLQVIAAVGAVAWEGELEAPFDLAHGPLLRALLVRRGERHHTLSLRLPALCADSRSLENFAAELARFYAGDIDEPVAMQYADYAAWLHDQLQDEGAAAARAHWRAYDAPGLTGVRLPGERAPGGAFAPAALAELWPAGRWRAITVAASRGGVAPEAWLLAAWQSLLSRLAAATLPAGTAQIPIGVLSDGREFAETQDALGLYARYLPVAPAAGEPAEDSLFERAAKLQQAREAGRAWQDSFSWGTGGTADFFPYCFDFAELPPSVVSRDLALRVTHLAVCLDRFKLRLGCRVSPEGLSVELAYDPTGYDAVAAARLAEQLRALVDGALCAPAAPLSALSLLSAAARHQVLHGWNDAPAPGTLAAASVPQVFARQAAATPRAVALEHAGQSLTYAELAERVDSLAGFLRARRVGPEAVVALYLGRSPELVIALLAVLAAGGAYLPLDLELPAERIAFMLEDSGAALALTSGDLVAALPAGPARVVRLDAAEAAAAAAGGGARWAPPAAPLPDQLAYVIYTSGSTGRPKGTLISHRSLANYLSWAVAAYVSSASGASGAEDGDGAPLHSPLAFDLTVTSLFVPLLTGRRLTLVAESPGLDGLREELRGERDYSFVKLTPAHLEVLRRQLGEGATGETAAASVGCRGFIVGGEALPAALASWWRERAPALWIWNEYGPTEATVGCSVHRLQPSDPTVGDLPIGRPIAGLRLHVVDEHLEPVPAGVAGELAIAGAGLARGYLGQPGLTAARFVPNPHATVAGERLYRTGDFARHQLDGTLEFLGRRDQQVKLHGYRIELGEIEAALRRHPAVREAVVLLDEETAGQPRLCACWTGTSPGPSAAELAAELERQLPSYMVPRLYVGLAALPLTGNGKLDRAALRQLVRRHSTVPQKAYRPPRTRVERILAELWAALLPVERVGLDDSFFALGGDSIVSLQLLGRASQRGLRLTTRQIFDHPTLAALAAVATEAMATTAEQRPVTGPVLLTPILRSFFALPDPAPSHYSLLVALDLRRPLAEARLAAAVAALWHHHDALRLRFRQTGGAWTAENAGIEAPAPFAVLDLEALPAAAREGAFAAAAARLASGFDLAAGPLARWVLCRLGAAGAGADRADRADRRLLAVVHHLVADAVSLRILREDLETACGGRAALPPKSTSFQSWAVALAAQADSAELRAELGYWLAPPRRAAVSLPVDGVPLQPVVGTASTCRQELDAPTTRALLREVPRAYHTEISDVLLAALALTFNRWCGGPVLVDLEGHGREEVGVGLDPTRTVGWFTSLYPVLLDVPAGAPVGQVLVGIKEELRRVPRRGVGYGLLRHLASDGAVRTALAGMPAAQISFNYLGQLDAGSASGRESSWFVPAGELGVATQGPVRHRPYLLEVNAFIAGGRLEVEWRYDREAHRRSTIEELGRGFLADLSALVAHCRAREVGGHTPADFPLARLDTARLDRLTAVYGEIADLYPLAPMQESLLLHTLSFPGSDVGFEQMALDLPDPLDALALRQTWRRLAERHAVLRTCFAWQGEAEALQVVLPTAEPPWVEIDLAALPPGASARAWRDVLAADQARGFDLARAPLSRLALVRFPSEEARLVWSRHHALLDGWLTALLLAEQATLYRALSSGQEAELPPLAPYRDYIAWLAGQDPARGAEHWRRRLAGISAPTPLPAERSARAERSGAPRRGGEQKILPVARSAALRETAGRHGLTVNVLLQAAWGCLLSRYSGEVDVLFGATVAGRPAELAGVETMVGLFIKNLPVRAHCAPESPVLALLHALQRAQVELAEHEATAPADLQPWSEVPGFLPLFESLVVFENYPVATAAIRIAAEADTAGTAGTADPAGAAPESAAVRTAYPLTLAAAQDLRLVLLLAYDGDRFEATAVRRMLAHLETLLGGIADDPRAPLGALPLLTPGERHQLLCEWGWEAAGEQWRVLDPQGQLLPMGATGELHRARPAAPPVGTGEAAFHHADGRIERLGALDRLVRLQGRLLDPRRLEEALVEHPAVAAAAVVVRGPRLLAYVESAVARGGALGPGDLRGFLRRRWSAGPQPTEIVVLPSLPRRPDGTVDPAALPTPEGERLAAELAADLLGAGGDLLATQLGRLWEEVLGTRPIAPDDDFFALGGTSVAALRLAGRIREELGRDVPLALFYRAATVRDLAAQLRNGEPADGWSPLVAIRPSGGRRPFFCVHPVGGNVLGFLDLARRLDPGRPFYGLQAVGLGGGRPPHSELAGMAAEYLAEIRRVQPAGPYCLGGLSFGGFVAFEIAHQLRDQGEDVALLALLDTGSPLYRGTTTIWAEPVEVLALQADVIARSSGVDIGLDTGELRRLDRPAQVDAVVARLLATVEAARQVGAEHLRRLLALYESHAQCLAGYRPRPYPGRLTVFRAREENRELAAILQHPAQGEPDYGWGELSGEPIEVRWVPGTHSTMTYEPAVAGLAAELDAALAAADPQVGR